MPLHHGNLYPRRFCSEPCHRVFKNREASRGRLFYPLVMTMRYDREHFGEARRLLWNIARAARDADKHSRDGRRSWEPIERMREKIPLGFGFQGDKR